MSRLTRKDNISVFRYSLKRNHDPSDFGNYDAFYDYHMAIKRLGEIEDLLEPIPAEEWNEDDFFVIWWRLPIEEPPYIGSPMCDDWTENYYTHFTRLIEPKEESE